MIRLRILAGCLLLLVGGLQGWTQYRAYHYRYHPALGTPLWQVQAFSQRHALYVPWAVLGWAWQWDGTQQTAADRGGGRGEWHAAGPRRSVRRWDTTATARNHPRCRGMAPRPGPRKKDVRRVEAVCQARAGARELPGARAPLRWPGECACWSGPSGPAKGPALSSPACWSWRSIRL